MEILHAQCCGLDVHQKTIVACVRLVERGRVRQEVRTFASTVEGLLQLADWLESERVTSVAMESTGVYWKPVWHVLDGRFDLTLANAQQVRNLPGRKTDVNDAVWIADLLAHGLIRGSFVPPVPIQELRDLTRTRTQLTREVARHTQRIQKTLEDANVKLTGVLSDILGVTGRAILEALIAGEADVTRLAKLRRGRVKATPEELMEAVRGRLRDHHRFLLRLHLSQIDSLQLAISELEARAGDLLAPFRPTLDHLVTIPGVSETTARVVIAEIGIDMSRFATAGHLLSWAGLCPRSDESAGKRRSTRVRVGNRWLKTALVQAAWAASRKKDSYLRAQYLRLKTRRGGKKAVVAVAATLLTSIYYMLQRDEAYLDLGPLHFDRNARRRVARRLIQRLRDLGLQVDVKEAA